MIPLVFSHSPLAFSHSPLAFSHIDDESGVCLYFGTIEARRLSPQHSFRVAAREPDNVMLGV